MYLLESFQRIHLVNFPVYLPTNNYVFFVLVIDAGAKLVSETLYKPSGTENDLIEVGPGNLKLIYSGTEGKLIQYIDSGSSVYITFPLQCVTHFISISLT